MMIVATVVLIINSSTWKDLNIFDEYTNKMNDIMADDVHYKNGYLARFGIPENYEELRRHYEG
ncbi:MAG: hypothetical protein K6F49_05170 [Saccharofermentans sp.]|nr:hypothetical protein [Saccharofermentans sp.]